MKKLFIVHLLAFFSLCVMAVPVQRGQWKTITVDDGSTLMVEAVGDELCHYWRSSNGDVYIQVNDKYVKTSVHELQESVASQRAEMGAMRDARFEKYFGYKFGERRDGCKKLPGLRQLTGVYKGLVLLIEFSDIQFDPIHTPEFYSKVLNEGVDGYPDLQARGYGESVKQYFFDQSNDNFSVDFDVLPIIRMPKAHTYYTHDVRSMISYAIDLLKSDPTYDWSLYDWDDDDEIDMVFVLYAGYGQATKTDDPTLIWPHESSMGYYNLVVDGKLFNTYACANEINWNFGNGDIDSGIGTFCHEFAHCLGHPDLYDVCGKCDDLTAMDFWDLLDAGSYNGNGFYPAPFSAFEKITAGWLSPIELEAGKEYNHLRPITDKDGGDVYVMTNPNNHDEFYVFEPIQNTSWASGFYRAQGMRVLHIDYKPDAWSFNHVNCSEKPDYNTISRYTYIPADGNYECSSTSQVRGDLYPYKTTDFVELMWNTGDVNGNKACPIRLYDVRLNDDKTVSFKTEKVATDDAEAIAPIISEGGGQPIIYNLAGQKVGDNYRGVVVRDDKRTLEYHAAE